ncbi:MAG: MBL fold metallo-hydrolase, partial [Cyanobacteria bacterium J083]
KTPRPLWDNVFAFAPNRQTLGGTSYFIVRKFGNILIDCPAWDETHQNFIQTQGGINQIIITHRGGMGKQVKQMQKDLACQVIIQEQEAYLLPEVSVITFEQKLDLASDIEIIWTPGHSPGSSCIYWRQKGGILLTGRHLLPTSPHTFMPLRTAKTFHWRRQLASLEKLRDRFSADNLAYILPGANTGCLRGKGYIAAAGAKLQQLEINSLPQDFSSIL